MLDPRRRWRAASPAARAVVAISLVGAAALCAVLYAAVTSVPYLATAPTTDPLFGSLNACLLKTLDGPRLGFAVSPDGLSVAAYGESKVAICTSEGAGQTVALPGITAAAFDGERALWLAAAGAPGIEPGLWRMPDPHVSNDPPSRTGALVPAAMAGHASGVVAVDLQGRLLSISAGSAGAAVGPGAVQAMAPLPVNAPGASLAVAPGGKTVAVVVGGWLGLYRTADLKQLRAESPCPVEGVWWLESERNLLLACGGPDPWALELNHAIDQYRLAPPQARVPSLRLWRAGAYVQPCDALPCSAPSPSNPR